MRALVRRLLSLVAVAVVAALPLNVCSAKDDITIHGDTMGTTYSIMIPSPPSGFDADAAKHRIEDALATINGQMSTYDPESEVSRFNASRKTDWFDVSPATATVVAEALEICRLSGGAYDVTIQPLTDVWSFGPGRRERTVPSRDEIAAARSQMGYEHVHARLEPPALRKDIPELSVDLSSIAKGYGVDRLARLLDEMHVSSYMVEIGGELRTRGRRSPERPWRIGLERPVENRRAVQRVVSLDGQALATSGDYRQFFEVDGERYSHILDPRNGMPVSHALASVSVVADRCAVADAWATTLMVLGPEAGAALAESQGLAVFFVKRSETGFQEQMTAGFAPFTEEQEAAAAGGSPWLLFGIALLVFLVAVVGMSIGALLRGKCLTGSCGGLANLKDGQGRPACEACQTPSPECLGENGERVESNAASGSNRFS